MTAEILNLMEERRHKKGNPMQYRQIERIIKHVIIQCEVIMRDVNLGSLTKIDIKMYIHNT